MATWGQATPLTWNDAGGHLVGYGYYCGGAIAESGTLDSVSVAVKGSGGAADGYISVYKGSTMSGATKIAEVHVTSTLSTSVSEQTFSFTSGDKTFTAGDKLWVCVLVPSGSIAADFNVYVKTYTNGVGDFEVLSGSYRRGYVPNSGGYTTLPSTMTTQVNPFDANPLALYLTYSAGASAVAPLAAAYYAMS